MNYDPKKDLEQQLNPAKATFNEAKDQAQNVYEEGKNQAESMYEQGKKQAEAVYQQVKETATQVIDESKRKFCDVEKELSAYSSELIKTVKEKPMTSILMAGAVGYLISALFKK